MKKELGKPQSDSDVVNSEPRILLIGYGWLGQYYHKYFATADIVTSECFQEKKYDHYDMAIVGLPTPMNEETGQCDTSIVESCVREYSDIVDLFLIKSTVEIGTSDKLQEKYSVPVCMSPEFLGETLGHPLTEPKRDMFQIIGGEKKYRELAGEYFMRVLNANAVIKFVSNIEAETIKYCENMWITYRVVYWNSVFEMCELNGASYQNVRNGICLDPRMSRTHSNVYSDNRGFAGKCLLKDMSALIYTMRSNGLAMPVLEKMMEHNAFVRRNNKETNKLLPLAPPWCKVIKLTQGKYTIVDEDMYDELSKYNWYYAHGYAVRSTNNGMPQIRMHRQINNTPPHFDTDHINGNKLDNRKSNLRTATRSQNVANSFVKLNNKSGYKGVSWKKANNKWVAQITLGNNKVKHLGLFDDKKEAAKAYNEAVKRYHGEFGYLNNIDET